MQFIRPKTIQALRPLEPRCTFDWVCKNIRTPDTGKSFNYLDFPWSRGICDAWDDPKVRQVTLQFAARLGKTLLSCSLMLSSIEYDPCQGMIGSTNEKLLREIIRDKYYPMLERCFKTSDLVPSAYLRSATRIDLSTCRIYGAWSGSPSTLADKAPRNKHGGEVDKWDSEESTEADPLDLFLERGIEIPDRKTIIESTPSIEGKSRIETHLINGWNARFAVPCPLCGEYEPLGIGEEGKTGGIIYDGLFDGEHDRVRARKTARYQCPLCCEEWGDEHRRQVIQKGVWRPDGMVANRDGVLEGEMVGVYENASFQLGRQYAPTFSFGDIADQMARCYLDPERWHNFDNSWKGVTHRIIRTTFTWEEIGKRLNGGYSLQKVPKPCVFLTCGVDVQKDHYVFVVVGWSRGAVGYTVDYGVAHNEHELTKVIRQKYNHMDGGAPIGISLTLIDSGEGERQDEIFDLCRRVNLPSGPWVWPSKGSSGVLSNGKPFRQQTLEELSGDRKTAKRRHRSAIKKGVAGFWHITVSTPFFQSWMHAALHSRKPGTEKSLALPVEAERDEDFLRQLVNEVQSVKKNKSGRNKLEWVVADESVPLDFRDAMRYARCGAEVFVRSAWNRVAIERIIQAPGKGEKPASKTKTGGKSRQVLSSGKSVRRLDGSRFIR
jgi:phage terminase large subunit GpA-like protein